MTRRRRHQGTAHVGAHYGHHVTACTYCGETDRSMLLAAGWCLRCEDRRTVLWDRLREVQRRAA